ncbi:putative transcriptional regulatory protein [bacterium BMS3Bbin06]|nr:putative transcriptional regulatory protein [bacterium BMS3Abin08]GBE35040.1 putative transcriptional regulatory protein [bacterium BMS3Bbin06]HDO36027.1 YebC/PmpR family DNA-binding transcriptional regulator [Nitrospirota bacterium]HDY71887.1 YebC/PmpR family DNA-binding transcriptional regulator [Nitrospirota bacterium]
MSGHSKWSQIKHKKAVVDAKRGKVFSKIAKEISVAARLGGGDPVMNPRLRTAIEKAKETNMPHDNIKRAIQKGTGELPGTTYEETVYEGYGPGGVAILLEALTDNKNRTVAEIRHLLGKHGGSLGEAGCVSWIFEKKGYILVSKDSIDEDSLMSLAIEAGAEDMKNDPGEDNYEIITLPEDFLPVKDVLLQNGVSISAAEVTMFPKSTVSLTGDDAVKMLNLMEVLEDHDDIQNVYANFDIPDEVMAGIEK